MLFVLLYIFCSLYEGRVLIHRRIERCLDLEQNLWYTCIYIHLAIFVFGVKGSDVLAGVSAKARHSFVLGSR